MASFTKSSDNELHLSDSTIVKVHQHAYGAAGKAPFKQAIEKNAAGLGNYNPYYCKYTGLTYSFFLTVGQRHDSVVA